MKLNNYYHDRGIQKYMGFYLSEHTREIDKENRESRRFNFGLEEMSYEAISEVIEIALVKDLPVVIQPNVKSMDNRGFRDNIMGKVLGFNGDILFLSNGQIQLDLIRHIVITPSVKWYLKEGVS
ncbi:MULTISPECIES: hypothetical protein [Vagococcus]|uniref:DNA-directed RNA polymerase beta subunit n=1 Tax=Vagococcus fluvialis bH819 TaxID=1255619 RepID=A0A1X6WN51_9ENTE|nr:MULTISPECIES: hypothetical protein [Vagococcus]SLM85771.1 hypothetical protein FM121_06700 [Vagococcus fluvialis bH819]HCM90192.1 hypothetical protein [Vagococcus sp.]